MGTIAKTSATPVGYLIPGLEVQLVPELKLTAFLHGGVHYCLDVVVTYQVHMYSALDACTIPVDSQEYKIYQHQYITTTG